MAEDSIKIRLFGESLRVHNLLIRAEYLSKFNKIANRLNKPLEKAILDVRYFNLMGLNRYKSIEGLKKENIENSFWGLIFNGKETIEIKAGRKRLGKFSIRDLVIEETLFPIFNVKFDLINIRNYKGLVLAQKEIGKVAEFHIKKESFDVNKLQLSIGHLEYLDTEFQLLYKLMYNGIDLQSVKSDTLISYTHCHNFQTTTK